jgi:hypothetical protein
MNLRITLTAATWAAGAIFAIGAFGGAAFAGKSLADVCTETGQSGAAACACSQTLADETLSADEQALAVRLIGQDIEAREEVQGMSDGGTAFIAKIQAWGERVAAECG